MVAVQVAFPSVRVGFVLRLLEESVRGFEIVQLGLFDVVDQRPNHLRQQRVVEVKSPVLQPGFNLFQAVVVQIVGDGNASVLGTRRDFQSFLLFEELSRLRYLSGRKLRKQDRPLLADRFWFMGCRGRVFLAKRSDRLAACSA